MKTSPLRPTVMASALLLGSWILTRLVAADTCPAPGFAGPRSFEAGIWPQSFAVGDFNRDGKPDVAVANAGCMDYCSGGESVSVLLGNGDGSFQTAVNYQAGTVPVSIVSADLNGDGRLDLAVANTGYPASSNPPVPLVEGNVAVLLGNGDGTFQAAVSFATGLEPFCVVVADFNGDRDLDLAVANNGSVSVLLGAGEGTFRSAVNSGVEFGAAGVHSWSRIRRQVVAAGDLNGDGKADLALVRHDFGVVSVLPGNGDGTFLPTVDHYAAGPYPPAAVTVADLNGDGSLDLAVTNTDTGGRLGDHNSVSVFLREGGGGFKTATDYRTGAWAGAVGSVFVATGDLNSDGVPDLAVANGDSGSVSVLLGKDRGTFGTAVDYDAGTAYALAMEDLDRDGKLDLLVLGSNISVLLGNGDGTFPTAVKFAPGRLPVSTSVADFNADGRLDLAVANSYSVDPETADSYRADVSVLLGDGNGSFRSPVHYLVGRGPGFVAAGDFNGDGAPDLVVANHLDVQPAQTTNGSVSVLLNTRDGSIQPATTYYGGVDWPVSLVARDFDGDGNLDVAAANAGNSPGHLSSMTNCSVSVFLGKGDGTLEPAVSHPLGSLGLGFILYIPTRRNVIAAPDLNGDGKPDLVVGGVRDNAVPTIAVLLGRGDGTFADPVNVAAGDYGYPTAVATADFNRDGKADVALCDGNHLTVLLGNGDATFQAPFNPAPPDLYPQSMTLGDLDGDGSTDVLLHRSGGTSVLFGNGDGTFRPVVNYGAAAGAGYAPLMTTGDFNGDGHPDLVVADGINVSVHLAICADAGPELVVRRSGLTARISWAGPSTGFVLESAMSLSAMDWQPAAEAPTLNADRWEVTTPLGQAERYFRLRKPSP